MGLDLVIGKNRIVEQAMQYEFHDSGPTNYYRFLADAILNGLYSQKGEVLSEVKDLFRQRRPAKRSDLPSDITLGEVDRYGNQKVTYEDRRSEFLAFGSASEDRFIFDKVVRSWDITTLGELKVKLQGWNNG